MADSSPDTEIVVLRGRVIEKILNAGTVMERHFVALERESGGQFLALHDKKDKGRDFTDLLGKWVEVEGHVWMQSLMARSIVEVGDASD